jgi:hypothetical protein
VLPFEQASFPTWQISVLVVVMPPVQLVVQ